ncbi:MAG: carbamoyl-phosphate synthase (glutamine-hydrolyzing) large subunit [Candidatus Brocadiia bacterium]
MKPSKVLVLGSSALKIGEAGEFDYSGSQAIKALREEGIATVLANPNVATIQTSEGLADEVYFVPITPEYIEQIIEHEKPDAILLSVGGQTALNCGVRLYREGVLSRHGVRVLGTPVEAIIDTEDRERFVKRLDEIRVPTPRSKPTANVGEAIAAARELGFPCMARVAFALGGLGSGRCNNEAELEQLAGKAFAHTKQLLVEEYLWGWKEIEYEVVRDSNGTALTICNMENLDPMGIHTGESIVVTPSQTLTNEEYHSLREASIRIASYLGIVGECNVQFALSPQTSEFRVIEINARLSRSSALASKATGYPLAFVSTKLALGYALSEIENSVTRASKACFEPALDYIVVKIPRWDFKKFKHVSSRLGSSMKSVGEVMAFGRKFEEALQKAIRMLDVGADGATLNRNMRFDDVRKALAEPTEKRLFALAAALQSGMTSEEVADITRIDKWFVDKIGNLVRTADRLTEGGITGLDAVNMLEAKRFGFSDRQIARAVKSTEDEVFALRKSLGVRPVVKQVDTMAAEYPAVTNYLYLTYNGTENDVEFGQEGAAIVLGSGAYRIGSSVEFDWCCVNTVRTLRGIGYGTIMVNHNPETVSTDYDECDRLYFEEISLETLSEIYETERPIGVIISMGGQVPNNLALPCAARHMRVLGTSPADIDRAEDRNKFSSLLESLGIPQPQWRELTSYEEALSFAEGVGYPVIVRPSYVLSGAAMGVAGTAAELDALLRAAREISSVHPVVISKFIENAKELDLDGVARDGELVLWAVSEHVENAGVHSGDATLVLPPQRTYIETMRQIRRITGQVAQALNIVGPFNIQFLAKDNQVMVIECNLRASRSFPFVSKVMMTNFIDAAARVIMGRRIAPPTRSFFDLDYVGVKAPQFSFTRLDGADPTLGVEMASTGEVACLGWDFDEAFLKALTSVGFRFPIRSALLSTGPLESKIGFVKGAKALAQLGVKFHATHGTAVFLREQGLDVEEVFWPLEGGHPNALDVIRSGGLDLVVNIPKHFQEEELTNDYYIRRTAVDLGVPLVTNLQIAQRLAEAVSRLKFEDLRVRSWNEYRNS